MPASEISITALPEWYRTERETAKIIDKLYSVKELDFYLRNPDEFIRRLAILRINSFNEKDTLNILNEIVENSLETEANKYLAAWILKCISKRQGAGIFTRSRLAGNFSGFESFDDLFIVKFDNLVTSVDFDFSGSHIYSSLKLDNTDCALERDVLFETEFNFKGWLQKLLLSKSQKVIKALKAVPASLLEIPAHIGFLLKSLIKKLTKYHTRKTVNNLNESKRRNGRESIKLNNTSHSLNDLRYKLDNKPGVYVFLKKGVFQVLYFLFFPVRFARRHKLIIISSFLAIYMLMTYTEYGRAITNKYMKLDLLKAQNVAFEKIRGLSYFASNEINRITGLDDWEMIENNNKAIKTANVSNDWLSAERYFIVTAKKGLNIRKSPDLSSEKIGSTSLPFGSTVAYLSKVQKDKSGVTWFYVKTQDGRTGWVSAKFLKEKTES